jgi:hypothetical protein
MSSRLGYAAAFLAGATVAVVAATWIDDVREAVSSAPTFSPSHASVSDSTATQSSKVTSPLEESRPTFPHDFACQPRARESLHDEFQRLLRELVQSPERERADRVSLLLARLRQGGPAGVPVVIDYLRSGRNVRSNILFGDAGLFGGGSYYRDLRTLLFLTLTQIAKSHPSFQHEIAAAGLEQTRELADVLALVEIAASDATTRAQAIVALTRLGKEEDIYQHFYASAGAMVRLNHEELAPILAALLEKKPFHHYVDSYLASLWTVSDETRRTMSRRLIESDAVRAVMRNSPASWLWLDAREPEFRAAIVQDFQAASHEEHQLNLLRKIGADRRTTRLRFFDFPIGENTPLPGAPDSREQATARIALLDALTPFCNTPLLRAHREEARAQLAALIAQP